MMNYIRNNAPKNSNTDFAVTLSKKIWTMLVISSLVVTLFTLLFNKSSNLVSNLALLPASYFVSLIITERLFRKQVGLALICIEIVMFCRFIMIPVLFALTDNYSGVTVFGADYESAVWLMVYEELTVSAAMCLWGMADHKEKPDLNSLNDSTKPKYIRPMTIAIIAFWFFIIAVNAKLRGYLLNFSLITRAEMGFTEYVSLSDYQADIPGVFRVFFKIGLVVVFTTIVNFISNRKWRGFVKVIMLAVACVGFISSMWSSGFSVSRWGMLIAVICSIYVLMNAFPARKKAILLVGISGVVFVVLVGSLLKVMSFGVSDATIMTSASKYLSAEYFDEYFNGIAPVANGIITGDIYGNERGPEGILVDCFYNFPYAMKILGLSGTDVANNYFHYTTDHYDLIMPTVAISRMQFGVILSPLYSVVLVLLALKFDINQRSARTLYKKLFYTILVFWFSLFMALNPNIIESNVWYGFFGLILISVEEKFRIVMQR